MQTPDSTMDFYLLITVIKFLDLSCLEAAGSNRVLGAWL